MSLRLFFARHRRIILFCCIIGALSSCARKNRGVYDFLPEPQALMCRLNLPYLGRVQKIYNPFNHQYNLSWLPISMAAIPHGFTIQGYAVYAGTTLKLFSRLPFLRLTQQACTCEFVMNQPFSIDQFFGVAPVFKDQQGNEIIGLITIAKTF